MQVLNKLLSLANNARTKRADPKAWNGMVWNTTTFTNSIFSVTGKVSPHPQSILHRSLLLYRAARTDVIVVIKSLEGVGLVSLKVQHREIFNLINQCCGSAPGIPDPVPF